MAGKLIVKEDLSEVPKTCGNSEFLRSNYTHTSFGPPKGSVFRKKHSPAIKVKIQVGEILFHVARYIYNNRQFIDNLLKQFTLNHI